MSLGIVTIELSGAFHSGTESETHTHTHREREREREIFNPAAEQAGLKVEGEE